VERLRGANAAAVLQLMVLLACGNGRYVSHKRYICSPSLANIRSSSDQRATRARHETCLHGSGHTVRGDGGSVARSTGAGYGIRHIRIDARPGVDFLF